MEMNDEMKRQLADFQQLQQQLQMVSYQKQQIALQVQELEKASEELGKSAEGKTVYRFVGTLFVPKNKPELAKNLADEKESLQLRLKSVQKQEEKLTERLESIKKWFDKAQRSGGENASIAK
ncbi:prefoldin subunit beta [Candidatus Micrarchaeota archaeon]|nr:prefoldin subunit beta [Candidatus Micrarchaeota archaeon]